MRLSGPSRWLALAGAVLLAVVIADTLAPAAWQVRSGLHYLIEHFIAYFVVTLIICLAWPRPVILAATLMALAGLLEAGQGLTADRVPDLATAFCGAAGVLVGALLADLVNGWSRSEAPATKA
jgi:hypothetical protein